MDVWSRLFVLLLILLVVFLVGIFWVAIIFWLGRILGRNNGKKAREEAEKRERHDPVYCPYCGCKEYPDGKLRPFYKCFDCGRHFTVNRDLTPEEQEIVREEDEECARLRQSLPDIALYKEIMAAISSHAGWESARIEDSIGTITAKLYVKKPGFIPLHEEDHYWTSIDPIQMSYPLKTQAARMVFFRDLKAYVDREYGYSIETRIGYETSRCWLGISVKQIEQGNHRR